MKKKILLPILLLCVGSFAAATACVGSNTSSLDESSTPESSESLGSSGSSEALEPTEPTEPETIALSKDGVELEIEEEYTLSADYDGEKTLVWTVDDPTVVSVENGKLIGLNEGTATVTVTAGSVTDTCTVTVFGPREYSILLAENASSELKTAAGKLQSLVKEATGTSLPIEYGSATRSSVISLGKTPYAIDAGVTLPEDLFDYGYMITKVNGSIYIHAPTDIGVTFGVYGFLESEFNFECFSDMLYTIDQGDLKFKYYDDVTYGGADMGALYCGSAYLDGNAMRAMGYLERSSGIKGLNSDSTDPVSQQIPYKTYGELHPLWYYSATNGEGEPSPQQFCYTAGGDENEYNALVAKAAEVLEEQLKNLNTRSVRFSTKDNKFWCECEYCLKWEEIYGTESAVLTHFINDVAAEIDRWMENEGSEYKHNYEIDYLAYERTVQPSYNALIWNEATQTYTVDTSFKGTVTLQSGNSLDYSYENVLPAKHTVPVYASMRTNYHLSPDDPYNLEFKKQVLGWQALTKAGGTGMGIWSYFIDYKNYWIFYDSYTYMAEWYRLYAKAGNITWFYEESINSTTWKADPAKGYGGTAWTALRNYLATNLAKDTTLDLELLTEKFFKNYYGAAWQEMLDVFKATVAVSADMSKHFTYDVNAVSVPYHPDVIANGKTNLENMGSDYESAYPVYNDALNDAQYWSYDFVLGAYNAVTDALTKATAAKASNQIKNNIRAERLAYEYMLVHYYGNKFKVDELLTLKQQAKRDAELNNITDFSSKIKSTEIWAEWGV